MSFCRFSVHRILFSNVSIYDVGSASLLPLKDLELLLGLLTVKLHFTPVSGLQAYWLE